MVARSAGLAGRIAREDEWTGELGGFDEGEGLPAAYRFWKPTRGWSLGVFPISHRALLFSAPEKPARKYTSTGPRTALPPPGGGGAGSFHVGGFRVPRPNTFLIEMFIERLRRIAGERWVERVPNEECERGDPRIEYSRVSRVSIWNFERRSMNNCGFELRARDD